MARVDALLVGRVRPLGPSGVPSGIAKDVVTEPLSLDFLGFVGDEQGDTRYHGGQDKAVHHYPRDHYSAWQTELGDVPLLRAPGAFGENISSYGLTEADVAVGDRFRLGAALVEVTQGRQPCFRLNLRFGKPAMARAMQETGRTGWYYRVVEPGVVAPGDPLDLVERRSPAWTIQRLWRLLYIDTLDRDGLAQMVEFDHLPERWRAIAEERLRTGVVEDWTKRLDGT